MMLVGLISDTHGLLRAEAAHALAGVSRIIHAGDVGNEGVLHELRAIAPVDAVRGNVDFGPWADRLPLEETLDLEGHVIHIVHRIGDLDPDVNSSNTEAVIFGHTHKPLIEHRDGLLYINPGSAGPRRFALPVSIGFMRLARGQPIQAWLKELN